MVQMHKKIKLYADNVINIKKNKNIVWGPINQINYLVFFDIDILNRKKRSCGLHAEYIKKQNGNVPPI